MKTHASCRILWLVTAITFLASIGTGTTLHAQIVHTTAGTGTVGFSDDGTAATAAALSFPSGIAVDGSGNVYIADIDNSRIRKITAATGVISTIAGSGVNGFSGDGGSASAATLDNPPAVAVDCAGNVYIVDFHNSRIRKITAATGIITTIAGTATQGFSGDGGSATSAQLAGPQCVTVDVSGNVYIADTYNQRIRKITAATGIITTIAGTATQGFSGDGGPATAAQFRYPHGVAVDERGNVYIADGANNCIRKITASTGNISTIAGTGGTATGFSGDGGLATAGQLYDPKGIALDGSGNLFIVDHGNHCIRKVMASTGIISTIAGTGISGFSGDGGAAAAAQFYYPTDIALDHSGNVYIADFNNSRIRKITSAPTNVGGATPASVAIAYPNPTTGVFSLQIPGLKPGATLLVTNVTGKTVVAKTISKDALPARVDLTGFARGIYLVQVCADEKNYRTKIVLQ